jgi:predicted  nucleic acid-binding Zn-ribbon protein
MSQVDLLYRLQQTEDEIRKDKKRLTEVIRLQSESVELIMARTKAEDTESSIAGLRAIQKDLSLELDGLSDKVKREENRLYSGLVTNPKELEDLQKEIDSLGRRISILEDELFEAMLNVEEAEKNNEDAVETLNAVESEWKDTSARSKTEQTELLERISELAGQKKQLLPLIQPGSMIALETAKRRAGEMAVVTLKNGRCRGCLLGVSAMMQKAVDEGQLVSCDNCGRILCAV